MTSLPAFLETLAKRMTDGLLVAVSARAEADGRRTLRLCSTAAGGLELLEETTTDEASLVVARERIAAEGVALGMLQDG